MEHDLLTEDVPRRRRSNAVRIGRTRVGKGIFAQRHYRCCDIIGEITGTFIVDPHYGSDYCFNVGDGCCLEPDPPFRYVNHSCQPNCEFDWSDLAAADHGPVQKRVFLLALCDIRPGEELVIDYNWAAASAIPCRCGAANCRGWIVDPEDLALVQARDRAGPGRAAAPPPP